MITRIPDSEQFSPIYIGDMVTSLRKEDLYVFELSANRPFRWDYYRCNRDCLDEILYMFEKNIKDETKKNKWYLYLGKTGVSDLDDENAINFKKFSRKIKSIVEGGHRSKLSFSSALCFLIFWYAANNKLNEKIDISNFYNEYGEQKINFCGKDEFKKLYDLFANNTVKDIIQFFKKNKKEANKVFKSIKERKDILLVLTYTYFYWEKVLSTNDTIKNEDPLHLYNLCLYNIYFREEFVPQNQKYAFFDACNTKGLIVDLIDLVPREIASHFDGNNKSKILNCFENFYANSLKCSKDKKFIETKKGYTCCEYVMDIAYKSWLLENHVVDDLCNTAQNMYLNDTEYGIEVAIKNYGFCKTVEDAVAFFDECSKICDFIYHSTDNNLDLFRTYFMFNKEDGVEKVVWWYCILPLYTMNKKCKNEEIRKYVYEYLCKMKAFQHSNKKATRGTTSQSYINSMFSLTKIILTNDEYSIPKILSEDFKENWLNKMPKAKLKNALTRYIYEFDKEDIQRILKWDEFIFIKENNLNHDTLHRMFCDKSFKVDFDHVIPVKQYNMLVDTDDKESDNSKLGNFVMLESSLNRSKGDNLDKNSSHYSNSNFYLTSLLNENVRKELTNTQLSNIDFERFSEEKLNSFSTDNVDKRTIYLVDKYVDWIYDLSFDSKIAEASKMVTETVYAG